ncbi:MAG: DnaJ-class molecular chaperone with C-terminal Zn finger domain [Marinobacter excellens HL-55]|uniref:DnaJ-class molecular chaperone with C-terminal Zn finger domain n=1 Tax=Marinobacter excellens HL-55 TaxID=1305731 RepID=A0A0P7ZM66_9GAMM|nr:MAG: DnaJ-class molecular chaperone with C-terminal Zn finger domain [Marinobacter excellens HL-55]
MTTSSDATDRKPVAASTGGDSVWLSQHIQHLLVAVEHELRAAGPDGLSELDLIKALQRQPWQLIGSVNYHLPDQLYPVHFLLFHVLYTLRDQLATFGEALSISPLRLSIRQQHTVACDGLPGEEDKLRAFYLDLSKYHMSDDTIQKMMDDFWSGQSRPRPTQPDVSEAASTLGFSALPEQFAPVKQRFRKLVMQAHPDRGGDTEAIQKLNGAFSVLKAHYA